MPCPIVGRAGRVFHVVNRAIQDQLLFRDFGEYLAFQQRMVWALEVEPTRLLAFCLMPNHWHLLLQPRPDLEVSRFVKWLTSTHAKNLRRWRGSEGRGAVYQSRYRISAVDTERYFYVATRYVERNAARGGLVERAEQWPFGSASEAPRLQGIQLATWPVPRPSSWLTYLNDAESPADLDFIRRRTRRNEPIGEPRLDAEGAMTLESPIAIPAFASE